MFPVCAYCKKSIDGGRVYLLDEQPMHWKCRTRANAEAVAATKPTEPDIRVGANALWHHDLSKSVHQPRRCRVLAVSTKTANIEFFDKKTKTTREIRVLLTNLTLEKQ